MEEFYRIRRLPPYVFEEVNRAKAKARNAGADIIDLGMGNPDLPAPAHVIEKLKETLGKPRTDRYSASRGIPGLRRVFRLATRRADMKLAFRSHLFAYVLVNAGLVAINLITSPDYWWFVWPMMGWGLGLLAHGVTAASGT